MILSENPALDALQKGNLLGKYQRAYRIDRRLENEWNAQAPWRAGRQAPVMGPAQGESEHCHDE